MQLVSKIVVNINFRNHVELLKNAKKKLKK